jgi:hypothetical protein
MKLLAGKWSKITPKAIDPVDSNACEQFSLYFQDIMRSCDPGYPSIKGTGIIRVGAFSRMAIHKLTSN